MLKPIIWLMLGGVSLVVVAIVIDVRSKYGRD